MSRSSRAAATSKGDAQQTVHEPAKDRSCRQPKRKAPDDHVVGSGRSRKVKKVDNRSASEDSGEAETESEESQHGWMPTKAALKDRKLLKVSYYFQDRNSTSDGPSSRSGRAPLDAATSPGRPSTLRPAIRKVKEIKLEEPDPTWEEENNTDPVETVEGGEERVLKQDDLAAMALVRVVKAEYDKIAAKAKTERAEELEGLSVKAYHDGNDEIRKMTKEMMQSYGGLEKAFERIFLREITQAQDLVEGLLRARKKCDPEGNAGRVLKGITGVLEEELIEKYRFAWVAHLLKMRACGIGPKFAACQYYLLWFKKGVLDSIHSSMDRLVNEWSIFES